MASIKSLFRKAGDIHAGRCSQAANVDETAPWVPYADLSKPRRGIASRKSYDRLWRTEHVLATQIIRHGRLDAVYDSCSSVNEQITYA
jgi:hypothetical protein